MVTTSEVNTASCRLILLNIVSTAGVNTAQKRINLKICNPNSREVEFVLIKSFQANELQHSYDTNYWKWEKDQYEFKLKQKEEENEKIKSEFEKAKLDIEKFSNASKAMDSLLHTQIHDKLRRGISYNTTPPPYNNNYIHPISDLLETKNRKELPDEATKVDPLDKVVVETDSEEENSNDKSKENTVSGEIPLENHIITNEGCGKTWVKSKDIEKTEGKNQRRNNMAENRAPKKYHAQNKFANSKKNTPNKPRSNSKTKKANNFVQVWVPIVKKPVSTAIPDSTANRNSVANSVSTANQVSTANKASVASSSNVAKPIILTKYSSHEIPKKLIQTKLTDYINEKGQPKTTLAWVPSKTN
ncbi:hypothetical protein L6452_36063 [Arctium lappa]|uniref:Uncharacterized protein n=1 Tax=Arctium lappa TaxID=4217 RepID=A0ACB8Y868_ARCLA|nr:hypothetical protein L6452_36063 [Arctium lappa]